MPPERGNSAASSAYVSAPHSVTAPPSTQLSKNSGTSSTRWAIVAGVRKIPLPIVEPITTATALHRPSRRGRRSPQRSSGEEVDMGATIYAVSAYFPRHDPLVHAARLERGRLHLSAHHPRRHRPDHRLRDGVRGSLAAVQRQVAPAARSAHADRIRTPLGRRARERPRVGPRGVCLVAPTGSGERGAVRSEQDGLRRARPAHRTSPARRRDGQARAAALDRDPAPRHRDVVARDADRGGAGEETDPGRTTDPGRKPGEYGGPGVPGLAPGVSRGDRPGPELRYRATRRAHRQPGRGVGVPRLPAVQRADRARWELPAVHPVDPPATRVHAVRLLGAVGLAHAGARVWAWVVITAGEEAGKGPGKGEGPLPTSPFPGL